MRNEPQFQEIGDSMSIYTVGKFQWTVEGNSVIVTKDTPDGLFENIGFYQYESDERADLAAYRMAKLQANA